MCSPRVIIGTGRKCYSTRHKHGGEMGSRWRFTGVVALWLIIMHSGAYGAAAAQMPSGTWAPAASMAEARSGASAVLLQDGSVLIAGGAKDGEPLASVEI